MGVKDLWNILSPLCERQPLFELEGKTIAIDLSCWVVDSQTITDNHAQPKMYLRNLFFRTSYLLMHEIMPVFVLEGTAPALKHGTMARRNDIRGRGRARKAKAKGGRSQFNRILGECRKMLEYMGLACVQGHGEAEAMCAYLNEDGLVDGCISQDSDCFLYGAKVVYRNFCTTAKGNQNGTVDKYCLEKIEKVLSLGRNKMIALAMLCGCDYYDGLNGIGKEAALKFFRTVEDRDVLDRMKRWTTDTSLDRKEAELSNSKVCTSCGHNGRVQKHAKSGCVDCGTVIRCNDSYKEERALILNEIALRKKALQSEDFMSSELLNEFLARTDPVPTKLDLQWKQPQVEKFIEFMEDYLSWEPQYAFEKIFPLTTRWQILHLPGFPAADRSQIPDLFIPEAIKKIRNIRSIASYEIVWNNDHSIVRKLWEYAELDNNTQDEEPRELTTIEPQTKVTECYPQLVEEFEEARNAKRKKRPKGKKKAENAADENSKDPKPRGKRNARKIVDKNKKIDEFIVVNKPPLSLEESFEKMAITPKRSRKVEPLTLQDMVNSSSTPIKRGPQFDKVLQVENLSPRMNNSLDRMFNELSPDDFLSDGDENDDINMSAVIDSICGRRAFDFRIKKPGNTSGNNDGNSKATIGLNGDLEGIVSFQDNENNDPDRIINEDDNEANGSFDEFGAISDAYVPLSQRLAQEKVVQGSKASNEGLGKKFSLGIYDLLDDTKIEDF